MALTGSILLISVEGMSKNNIVINTIAPFNDKTCHSSIFIGT
jgi:hypothetical protein